MATTWKAPTWRMPNEKNQSKFESYSLDFDGTGYINVSANNIFNFGTGDFTLSAWIKVNSFSPSYYPYILDFRTSSTANERAVAFYLDDNGILQVWLEGSLKIGSSGTALAANTWHNVILKRENGTLSTHINGGSADQTSTYTGNMNTTPPLTIGARAGNIQEINGAISQVSIFDYALSSTQISSLYNSGSPINPMTLKPAPVAYYPLGGNASTGGDPLTATTPNTLSVPNVAVPDASVFDFIPNDYINLGEDVVPATPAWTSLTVSAWIKKDATGSYGRVIGKDDGGSNRVFLLQVQSNDKLSGSIRTAGGAWDNVQTTTDVAIGEWQHVAMTYTANGLIRLYINGEVEATDTNTIANLNSVTTDTLIGAKGNITNMFDGQISNVQIWDVEISPTEMLEVYNNGQPLMTGTQPQEANLQAWYKLNQTANWEADTAGNWQIPNNRSAYPQSFSFDGSTQKIQVRNDSFGLTQEITVSAWVRIPNGSAGGGAPNIQAIVSEDTTGGTTRNFALSWRGGTLKDFLFEVFSTDGTRQFLYSNAGDVNDGKWHHVVGTWDGTTNADAFKIYVDNVATSTTATKTGINIQSNVPTTIGAIPNTFTWAFEGNISNVQIWDTSLDSSQVETLYNNGVPLTTAIATDNLKGWWKLNNTELFDGTNWSVENQKYPANWESSFNSGASTGMLRDNDSKSEYDNQLFSMSVWVKPKSGVTTNGDIFACRGSSWQGVALNYNSNDLVFQIGDKNTTAINGQGGNWSYFNNRVAGASPTYTPYDQWSHIVVVWNGTNSKFYINGTLVSTITPPSALTIDYSFTGTISAIGGRNDAGGAYFTGNISNFAYWESELDQTAVTALYNNGTPEVTISQSPNHWFTLKDFVTGSVDQIGSLNYENTIGTVEFVDNFVSVETGTSSGMTEQNLVNNNVSALNGESSGMTSANLVTSTLTRQVPYNSYSLNFDGTSDYVQTGSITINNKFTFSCWLNIDSFSLTNQCFLSSPNYYTSGFDGNFIIRLNNNTTINFYSYDGTGSAEGITCTVPTISTGSWHHFALTNDGTTAKYYWNSSPITTTGVNTKGLDNLTAGLIIGDNITNNNNAFPGKINNVSIFNEALTSTEVLKVYNSGIPSDLSSFNPSPIAWWSLGSDSYFNGNDYICPDLIGTNNGTSSGMDANALVGDAPNSSANGTSTNMTIDANLAGNAPNSSNNSFSVNMSYDDRETDVPS